MRLPVDTGFVGSEDENAARSTRTIVVDDANLLVSVEQAACMLGIGRTRMFELVMSRAITSVKIGRRRLVVRRSLEEFIQCLVAAQAFPEDDQ
jgi:excisionase family DNA binding protein